MRPLLVTKLLPRSMLLSDLPLLFHLLTEALPVCHCFTPAPVVQHSGTQPCPCPQVRRPGPAYLTPDTYVNARTDACARLAAGACIDVAVAVARCARTVLPRLLGTGRPWVLQIALRVLHMGGSVA